MKEIVDKLLEGNFDYENGSLDFSCSKLELVMKKEETAEGSFHVYAAGAKATVGYVMSSHMRMECLTPEFIGNGEEIFYRFHAEGMEEGDVIKGEFYVISSQGEYYLPFLVTVIHATVDSSLGNIKNLFHFANLAKTNPEEAVKLFYSPGFSNVFTGNEKQFFNVYKGLSAYPGNEQNVEEFLLAINKKQKIEFLVQETEIRLEDPEGIVRTSLNIARNGWGYTGLKVETEGDFVYVEKETLSDDDFLGNNCTLPIYIDSALLHAGVNSGMIRLYDAYERTDIPVLVKYQPGQKRTGRTRISRKRLVLQLMEFYQAFRLKKISTATWLKETGKLIEKLISMDEKDVSARLFQAQLLITEERMNEAQWILDHAVGLLTKDEREDPVLQAYYLYLTTLISGDESYIDKIAEDVFGIYKMNRGNWRIAWLLLYLLDEYTKSATRKWMFLEEQFGRGCSSPVIYIEALLLLNANPTLLMKLGDFEKQVIAFGAKQEALSQEVILQFVYLVQKVREFSECLYRSMDACYRMKPDDRVLQEICALLIKGGRTGREYFKWYKRGVERELRITRLYEYYMMSADLNDMTMLPKMVLMYFSYQSSLDYERTAYLYVNVHKCRGEFPELYENYREPIERFLTEQILKMHINRDLAYLYKNLLEPRMISSQAAHALGRLLFMNQVQTERKDMRNVVVYHNGLNVEYVYPISDGRAWVPLFSNEFTMLFEDGMQNRYAVSVPHTTEKMVIPGRLLKSIAPMVGEQIGYDLYLCLSGRELAVITDENEERFRNVLQYKGVTQAYLREITVKLLQYYYDNDRITRIDEFLDELDAQELGAPERSEVLKYLVLRGKDDKAYEWLVRFGPDGVEPKTIVRLCSRLLDHTHPAEDALLTGIIIYAFQKGKYDENILKYLVKYYDGLTRELRDIWKAAKGFDVDTYELCEKMLIQMLFTGSYIGERMDIFRCYVNGGARTEVEMAFLRQCAYDYFVKERLTDGYVFEEIYRLFQQGVKPHRVSELAYLKYYAENRNEITEERRAVILTFMHEMMQDRVRLNFFREYINLSPATGQMIDKTIVEYRGHPGTRAVIHYMIEKEDGTESEYVTEDMREIFGGVCSKEFVLFFGERLQYYIVEEIGGEEQLTESGTIQKSDTNGSDTDNKFYLVNDIVMSSTLQDYDTLDTLLKEYYYKEYMRVHLFGLL